MKKTTHDSETLALNQQVISACAVIYTYIEGKINIFMPRRAETKKFLPGLYELPGGHINFGEDLIVGLKREIQEELNMDVDIENPIYAFTYLNDIKKSHTVEIIYLARFITPLQNLKINYQDHSEFIWINKENLELLKVQKQEDDHELKAIMKALELLDHK